MKKKKDSGIITVPKKMAVPSGKNVAPSVKKIKTSVSTNLIIIQSKF